MSEAKEFFEKMGQTINAVTEKVIEMMDRTREAMIEQGCPPVMAENIIQSSLVRAYAISLTSMIFSRSDEFGVSKDEAGRMLKELCEGIQDYASEIMLKYGKGKMKRISYGK